MYRGKTILAFIMLFSLSFIACSEDEDFTSSPDNLLTFSTDTVSLDTVFSSVPSVTRTMWVHNRSGKSIRCSNVRLEHGNQTGFRVNVDGIYLGSEAGFQTGDIEVRNKDSIRVFVELTSPLNNADEPVLWEDNLIFTLESGVNQKVNLNAYTWDVTILDSIHVASDTLIYSSKPIVIRKGIKVDEDVTLRIAAGTTLYFGNSAGIDVYGTLISEGTPDANVTLRGDRIDRMFDYLPYDFVSGQWQGIHFKTSSYENKLTYTDIHSTYDGVVVDSSDVDKQTLQLNAVTIHNCQGYGLLSYNSWIELTNCQITNTLRDCLAVYGGKATVNSCTIAQFYPFDANRGAALRFSAIPYPLISFNCLNSLITGYSDDEMMGEPGEEGVDFNYAFDHCIIRTPKITTDDSLKFTNVVYEDVEDTIGCGRKHFMKFDTENLRYNFDLDSLSTAIGCADPSTSAPTDRQGRIRDEKPDIGAYERIEN